MLAVELIVALQRTELGLGILIAILLAAALLVPYFLKEIRRGKAELGPRTPTGTGERAASDRVEDRCIETAHAVSDRRTTVATH